MNTLKLPTGSKLLKVAYQGLDPVLWALVPSKSPTPLGTEERHVLITFTGEEFSWHVNEYLGTDEVRGIVFHAFEVV